MLRTRGAVSRLRLEQACFGREETRQRPTRRGGHTEARLPSREGPLLSGPVPGAAQQVWRGERPQVQVPRPGGLRLDRLSSVPGGSRALEGEARRAVRGLVLGPVLCPGKRRGCFRVSGGSGLSRRAGAGELSPELGQALGGAGLEAASWRRYGAGPGTGDPGHRDELRRTWRPRALPRGGRAEVPHGAGPLAGPVAGVTRLQWLSQAGEGGETECTVWGGPLPPPRSRPRWFGGP